MPTVEANGITLAFDHFGSADAEPMVLISGLGVQMIRWTAPFCETLAAQGYRVIRFDNRDVGHSTHLDTAPIIEMAALAQAAGDDALGATPKAVSELSAALDARFVATRTRPWSFPFGSGQLRTGAINDLLPSGLYVRGAIPTPSPSLSWFEGPWQAFE